MRVAVVGGGLSGLTAAFYLHRAIPQASLSLYEADDSLGGVVVTERRGEWLVEHGADCFSTNPPHALDLCRDLGVEQDLIEPEMRGRGAMISRGSRLLPVPAGFVLMRPTRLSQVLRSPLLSWRGKARLAAERFVKPRVDESDESLASFVRRRFGPEALDRVVQPLVAGIYTADAERLSMQATMPQFVRMEREYGSLIGARPSDTAADGSRNRSLERHSSGARYGQFRAFPEGMGRLFDELRAALPEGSIHYGRRIEAIERQEGDRWRLRIAGGDTPTYDGLLLAVPAPAAAPLLAPLCAGAAAEMETIPYASSAVVLLGVATQQISRLPETFGFVVPAIDRRHILAASFASHKFPGRAPAGRTLIRVFIGGALQPQLLENDDTALIRIAREELAELIGMQGEPEWAAVRRWHRAMPQYHVGHLDRVARIKAEIAQLPGLEIAGNALHGVGIAPVVGTARQAAEQLAQTLRSRAARRS